MTKKEQTHKVYTLRVRSFFLYLFNIKGKDGVYLRPFSLELLRSLVLCCDNLNTLVEAASLANSVGEIVLTALGALNEVGRGLELPYARASLHLSCMRNLSLGNCHC